MANNKETITMTIDLDTSDFKKGLKDSEKELKKLEDKTEVKLKADSSEVSKEVTTAKNKVNEFENVDATAKLDAQDDASKVTDKVKSEVKSVDSTTGTAKVKVEDSQSSKVTARVKSEMASINNTYATAKVKMDDSKFMAGAKKVESKLDNISQKTTQAGQDLAPLSAGATALVGLSAKAYLEAESSLNRYATVFGSYEKDMDKFYKKNKENIMLTTGEWKAQSAGIGDLLKPLGFTEQQAGKTTQEIITLAEAQSRWADMPLPEAIERINAGIMGETEGLKALGVKIDAEMIKERQAIIMAEKRKGVTEEMARALAVQELVTEMSADAIKAYNQELKDGDEITTTFAKAQRDLRQGLEDLGYAIAPIIKGLIMFVGGLAKAFTTLPGPVKTLIGGLLVFVAVLSPLLLIFGALSASISAIIAILPALAGAFAVASGPVGLLVLAITGMVIAFWMAKEEIWKFIQDTIAWFGEWFTSIGEYFANFGTNMSNAWNVFTTAITDGLTTFGTNMTLGFHAIWTWITESWNAFTSGFIASWTNLGANVVALATGLMNGISNAFGIGFAFVLGKLGEFRTFFASIFSMLPSDVQSSLSQIFSGFQSVFNGIYNLVSSIMNGIVASVIAGVNGVLSAINRMKTAASNIDLNPFNAKGGKSGPTPQQINNTTSGDNIVTKSVRTTNNFVVQSNSNSLSKFASMRNITI